MKEIIINENDDNNNRPETTDFVDVRTYRHTDVLTFLTLTQVEPENK